MELNTKHRAPPDAAPRGPIGGEAVSLLRTVRACGGTCSVDALDDGAVQACLRLGVVEWSDRGRSAILITHAGLSYLDRLMRAH